MLIYNVVVSVDEEIAEEWKSWMRYTHIPDVLDTGYFINATMLRQTEPASEKDRVTYHIRYTCATQEQFQAYQEQAAPTLQADHTERYQGRFSASRTILFEEKLFTYE